MTPAPRRAAAMLCAVGAALLPFARPQAFSMAGKDVLLSDPFFLAAGFVLALGWVRGRVAPSFDRFHRLLLLCLCSVVASVLFSAEPRRSALLAVQRAYAMGLAVVAYEAARGAVDRRRIAEGWVAGGALSAAIMIAGAGAFFLGVRDPDVNPTIWNMGSLPDVGLPRVTGLMMNANAACNLLVSTGAIGAGLLAGRQAGWGTWVGAVGALGLAAAFTMSPGLGALALLVAVVTWLLVSQRRGAARTAAGVVLLGAAFAAVAMLVVTAIRLDVPPEGASRASSRALAWASSLQTFATHPIFGRGLGLSTADVTFATPRGVTEHLTTAHNTWLSVAAQQGLLGLVSLGALVAWLVRSAKPIGFLDPECALRTGLVLALVVVHGYQSLSLAVENQRHVWLVIGLLAAAVQGLGQGPRADVETAAT